MRPFKLGREQLWIATLLILFSVGNAFAQCSGFGSNTIPMDQYWTLREQMNQHFIRTCLDENGDLICDGIGAWDEDACHFEYAGYSLPASNLKMGFNTADGTPNNTLTWGENAVKWGRYVAMLSMEYHLLERNGQTQHLKRIRNEIFLALQAYRRLDMTAQRLMMKHLQRGGCNPNPPDYPQTGYSGFALRDDVPWRILDDFNSTNLTTCWQKGRVDSDYEEYRNLCNRGVQPPPNAGPPTDFCTQTIFSQDMVIGVLFGLSFVKRYIPATAKATPPGGQDYYLLDMAEKIAEGLVERIEKDNRRLLRDTCANGDIESVELAEGRGNASFMYYGMKKALDYIYPDNDLSSNLADFTSWSINVRSLYFQPEEHNVHMVIALMVAGDLFNSGVVNFPPTLLFFPTMEFLHGVMDDNSPMGMFHLAWEVLHNNAEPNFNYGGSHFHQQVRDKLCSMPCSGPCYKSSDYTVGVDGVAFDCNSTEGWCGPLAWDPNIPEELGCEFEHGPEGIKFNPMSYLMTYNLYRIAEAPNGYYKPDDIRVNEDLDRTSPGIMSINGPDNICSSVQETYIPIGLPTGSVFTVEVEGDLEILDFNTTSATVKATSNAGHGLIRFTEVPATATDCYIPRVVEKHVEIVGFRLKNAFDDTRSEFCWKEDIYLEIPDGRYLVKYTMLLVYFDEQTNQWEMGPQVAGIDPITNPINLTYLFENDPVANFTFEKGVRYKVLLFTNYNLCGSSNELQLDLKYIDPDVQLVDEGGLEKSEFCFAENVFLEVDQSTIVDDYCLEVSRKRPGQTDFIVLGRECFATLPEPLNINQWLADRSMDVEADAAYRVQLAYSDDCNPNRVVGKEFTFAPPLLSTYHFEDKNQVIRDQFCTNEDVFINGSASQNETRYWLEVGRAPIGTDIYDGLVSGWTYEPIETINFSEWMIDKGYPIEGGFVYQVKLGVQNDCYPWAEFTYRFQMQDCCSPPADLWCFEERVMRNLQWEDVSPTSRYFLYIDPTSSCCGNDDMNPPLAIPVTGNRYDLRNLSYQCFEWWVAVDCDNANSPASARQCFNESTECRNNRERTLPSLDDELTTSMLPTDLIIQPNPVGDFALVQILGKEDLKLIEIYNLAGTKMEGILTKVTDRTYRIDGGRLVAGVYLVHALIGEEMKTIRFVKQN
ncbi:MAG: T9SS type A sorting domain-containing protein [Bacteroidota bacterium]